MRIPFKKNSDVLVFCLVLNACVTTVVVVNSVEGLNDLGQEMS